MRGSPRRTNAAAVTYPRRLFGTRLRELVEAQDLPLRPLARLLDVGFGSLSHYMAGRNLPQDRDAVLALADALARSKSARPRLRTELVRLWHADLMDAHLRATGATAAEARRAIEDLAE